MDALEKLISVAEQCCQDNSKSKGATSPLSSLSPKELRRRFDEYGDPREGFDLDGNPVKGEGDCNGNSGKE